LCIRPDKFADAAPSIGPWVGDISERLQCPPDYVAVTGFTSLGALIGRRIGIKPQQKTDWLEVPNVWGCFVGKPGMLKSPAMMEALKPLHHLEAGAAKAHAAALVEHTAALAEFKIHKSVKESVLKEALKKKITEKVVSLEDVSSLKNMIKEAQKEDDPLGLGAGPEEPRPVRYRTNDSSYEAIGALLVSNSPGLLVERDELVSLLKHLDREEQCVARGFYLSGWSGTQPYTFDRIGRGHIHIEAVCIGVLGNTQPAKLAEYVRRANADGAGGDGLIQRRGNGRHRYRCRRGDPDSHPKGRPQGRLYGPRRAPAGLVEADGSGPCPARARPPGRSRPPR
jgi:Protein of unknown function (DUF3987)